MGANELCYKNWVAAKITVPLGDKLPTLHLYFGISLKIKGFLAIFFTGLREPKDIDKCAIVVE